MSWHIQYTHSWKQCLSKTTRPCGTETSLYSPVQYSKGIMNADPQGSQGTDGGSARNGVAQKVLSLDNYALTGVSHPSERMGLQIGMQEGTCVGLSLPISTDLVRITPQTSTGLTSNNERSQNPSAAIRRVHLCASMIVGPQQCRMISHCPLY